MQCHILVRIEAISPLTPSGRPPRPSEPEAEAEDGDAEGEISAESGDYAAHFQARVGRARSTTARRWWR